MSKEMSSKPAVFAKGGKTKMFGKQSAGPQKPGTTTHSVSGNGGKFGEKERKAARNAWHDFCNRR